MRSTLLMTENFIDSAVLPSIAVSSAQAAYPVSNLQDKKRRSKLWRSSGYFNIVSPNNVIIFQETISVDLTATITPGEYMTPGALCIAIKAALEAAGDSTYTVTWDANDNEFTIASNGSGGGNILVIRWSAGASAGMADILGFDASTDRSGSLSYLADVARIHTSEWITFDFGLSSNPMAFVLAGLRNRPIKLSPGATIRLMGNPTDAWDTPLFSQELIYDDEVMAIVTETGIFDIGYRYAKLEIIDRENPFGYIELGALFLGDCFGTDRGAVQFPFETDSLDRSEIITSEGGQITANEKEKTEMFQLSWAALTVSEKEGLRRIWENYGKTLPFFICLDKDAVFSSSQRRQIKYARFTVEPKWILESPTFFNCTMQLTEDL